MMLMMANAPTSTTRIMVEFFKNWKFGQKEDNSAFDPKIGVYRINAGKILEAFRAKDAGNRLFLLL